MKSLAIVAISTTLLLSAVDINSADKQALMSLDGVGDKKADAILAYRKVHCFKSVEELSRVKGIASKLLEKNRAELAVGECSTQLK